MATLTIEGRDVEIDDAFKTLSSAEQESIVHDIAGKLGIRGGVAPDMTLQSATPAPAATDGPAFGPNGRTDASGQRYDESGVPVGGVPLAKTETVSGSQPATQGSGLALNATAGMNEGLYSTIGAPVDLMRGTMNLGVRGINAVIGSDVPTIPDDSFGGSRSIAGMMGAIRPEFDPANTVAATPEERMTRAAGQGVAGTMLPAGIVGGAARAGMIGERAAATGAQMFGRSNSVRATAADALAGGAAGIGSAQVAEMTPEEYRSLGSFAGGLVGGGIGSLATGLPGLLREGAGLAGRYAEPFTAAGRERMVGRQLREASSDPGALRDTLDTVPAGRVAGSKPTTGQLTGDMGLLAAERGSQAKFPAEFNQRRADQNQARVGSLESIQPKGAAEAVTKAIRSHLGAIDDETQRAYLTAQDEARRRAQALGPGLVPDEAGASVRASMESARAAAKAQEKALWDAVDPDGSMALGPVRIREATAKLLKERTASAQPLTAAESQMYDAISGYGQTVPLREITDLKANLRTAMQEERGARGETPAYRRMSIVNGAIQQDLDRVVSAKAMRDEIDVREGRKRADQTLLADLQRQQEDFLAGQRADARSASGGGGPVGYAAGGSAPIPGLRGTAGEAGGELGPASGDPRVPRQGVGQEFDAPARERLRAATDASRDRAQTFDNKTLAPLRRRPAASGPYDMPDAAVVARIFSGQPKSFEAVGQLRRAVGDEAARASLEPYAVEQLRRAALRDDGTFDPGRLARWRQSHQDVLRAFPELDRRFADAGRASETMADVAAAQRQRVEDAQAGAVGRLMNLDDPEDITRTIGGMFGAQDSVARFMKLRKAIGSDEDAQRGLRRAVVDHIMVRFLSNTEAGTSGLGTVKSDAFQTFVKNNRGALRIAGFGDADMASMEAIAADLQRSNRSNTAVRNPGSNTAQDRFAIEKGDTPVSMLAKVIGASVKPAAGVGVGVGVFTGSPTSFAVGVGTVMAAALRENGIRTADELMRDALLNPERARYLLLKVPPKDARTEIGIAKRYRATVAATGAIALGGDEQTTRERPKPPRQPERARSASSRAP